VVTSLKVKIKEICHCKNVSIHESGGPERLKKYYKKCVDCDEEQAITKEQFLKLNIDAMNGALAEIKNNPDGKFFDNCGELYSLARRRSRQYNKTGVISIPLLKKSVFQGLLKDVIK